MFVKLLATVGSPCTVCQECASWYEHEYQDI